jgi:hypothetical protein
MTPLVLSLILAGLAIHAFPGDAMRRIATRMCVLPAPAMATAMVALMLVVDSMRYEGIAPFIYFRF